MNITIVGAGYVGLVTGSGLAELGWTVTCVDVDEDRITSLRQGKVPIFEPGLDDAVMRLQDSGRLHFTTDLAAAVARSAAVFLAVGTPPLDDGRADTSFVAAAAVDVANALCGFTVLVIKSTVPVGTGPYVERLIKQANPSADFAVVSNPEFLREGNAMADFMEPDRLVLGYNDPRAGAVMHEIYAPLEQRGVPTVATDIATSELIKYAANGFLATKVAFINEMADLCSAIGANVDDVSKALGLDARIGPSFLKPGPGYGGSCFPKDTLALAAQAQEADTPVRIVEAVAASNSHHIRRLVRKIERDCTAAWRTIGSEHFTLADSTLAVLGLAFKSNTDDIRYAASTVLLPQLMKQGVRIKAYDPQAMENAMAAIDGITCCSSIPEVLDGADAVLILTEWPEFANADWGRLKSTMSSPVVIDLRNIYSPDAMAQLGIEYYSLGRPPVSGAKALTENGKSKNDTLPHETPQGRAFVSAPAE